MRVGFDLDGVLYDFGNSVRRYLDSIGRQYNFHADRDEPHTWNFFEHWGMDRHEFLQICHDGVDAGFIFSGPARPNAAEAVSRVRRQGHEVVIITDRSFGTTPSVSEQATCEWLAQHGIWYDELIFSPNKTIVPTDMFVEDKLENYDALVKAGTEAFLITRDWNKVDGGDGRNRILDVLDYAEAVERVTKQGYSDLLIV